MKHEIEKLIWRKEQSLGLGDDEHLNHEQIGELMVEFAKGESRKACDLVLDKMTAKDSISYQFTLEGDKLSWSHEYYDSDLDPVSYGESAMWKESTDSFYKYIGMEW